MSPTKTETGAAGQTDYVPADVLINEARAAELLCVNPRTLQQWRLRGTGPKFVRISSRCVRYRYRDLMRWADDLLRSSTSEA